MDLTGDTIPTHPYKDHPTIPYLPDSRNPVGCRVYICWSQFGERAQSADWRTQSADWVPVCRLGLSLQIETKERTQSADFPPSCLNSLNWDFAWSTCVVTWSHESTVLYYARTRRKKSIDDCSRKGSHPSSMIPIGATWGESAD